jgi:hypothetical protein
MVELLNFEDVRQWSSNGKKPFPSRIGLAYGNIGARRDHRKAVINVDLFPGSMDIRDEVADELRTEYREYLKTAAPRKGRISDFHSHFNRTSIWFEVRPGDAGVWFRKLLTVLSEPECIVRTPEPFEDFYERLDETA